MKSTRAPTPIGTRRLVTDAPATPNRSTGSTSAESIRRGPLADAPLGLPLLDRGSLLETGASLAAEEGVVVVLP
jgi:hypothetical protein